MKFICNSSELGIYCMLKNKPTIEQANGKFDDVVILMILTRLFDVKSVKRISDVNISERYCEAKLEIELERKWRYNIVEEIDMINKEGLLSDEESENLKENLMDEPDCDDLKKYFSLIMESKYTEEERTYKECDAECNMVSKFTVEVIRVAKAKYIIYAKSKEEAESAAEESFLPSFVDNKDSKVEIEETEIEFSKCIAKATLKKEG